MDISKFQLGGEWLKLNIEGRKSLKVMVRPLSDKDQLEMAGTAKKEDMTLFLDEIKGLVLGWDLTEGKEPLECNEVNKKKYLPYLINMTLELTKEEALANEEIKDKRNELNSQIEKVKSETTDAELLKVLIGELKKKLIGLKEEDGKTVGLSILEFAQNFNNFIKN